MARDLLRKMFIDFTRDYLQRQQPDGLVPGMHVGPYGIAILARCYVMEHEDNPLYRDPQVLRAIQRVGELNLRNFDPSRGFVSDTPMGDSGWDEWRLIAWLEATLMLGDELTAPQREQWLQPFHAFGENLLRHCIDMDSFDGQIPNHGVWNHVLFYRVGVVLKEPRFREMAELALGRVVGAQTPDGVWREGQSAALFKGTPVTIYNLITGLALNLYCGWTQNPTVQQALDRAWHWYLDYLLPNGTTPPNFTMRQPYNGHGTWCLPAYFWNQPEGRRLVRHALERERQQQEGKPFASAHGRMFLALQYPWIDENVSEREPVWPAFQRMVSEEAGVRRQHGWHAHLSGMQNTGLSNQGMRLFANERQDCLSLYHERAGLLMGSAHSKIQPEASTFVFYETGCARYLHDEAYLKSSPALDTLLLRYGSNVGAASIDTNSPERARVLFSLHGERGRNDQPGRGHALSAMAAKAHLTLRLKAGNVLRVGERSWLLEENDEQMLRIRIESNQAADFGRWRITCVDGPWELRWPVQLVNHYKMLEPGERVGIAEVVLHRGAGAFATASAKDARPMAEFHIEVV